MRTVTYQSILDRIASYLGESDGLSVEDAALANVKINFFVRLGWKHFCHPDITRIEKRTFRPTYSATENVVAGDERYFPATQAYYVALVDQTPAVEAPATLTGGAYETNLAYWADATAQPDGEDWTAGTDYALGDTVRNLADGLIYQCHTAHTAGASFDDTKFAELPAFVRSLDPRAAGETEIGDVASIWDRDPTTNRAARRMRFRLRQGIIQVLGTANVVWVEFRPPPPNFSGVVRSDTATYAAGVTRFDTATGDFWTSNTSIAAGESPTSAPAKWDKVEFPEYLAEYVAQSAYAMLTNREQETPENFTIQLAAGYPLLLAEIQTIERQQGQTRQLNVVSGRN